MLARVIILFLLAGTGLESLAQMSSRNGYFIPPYDTINFLFVFAEVTGDTAHNYQEYDSAWLPGQLPGNFEKVIDHEFKGPDHISGWLTRLYYEASFGSYIVLGDYLDTLVQIPWSDIKKRSLGLEECMDFINNLPGDDIISKHGYRLCSDHFDRITSSFNYKPHGLIPDNTIDMLVVMFRTNSRIAKLEGGGFHIGVDNRLKSKEVKHYVLMRSLGNRPDLISHEIAHLLIGNNQFHTGGSGAGLSNFMSDVGGWGLLSLWNRNSRFANAWDRWWMGWKETSKQYYISALDRNHKEAATDFREGHYPVGGDSIFILRDFYRYGDVIRIELPVKRDHSSMPRQYLWIENHANTEDWEHDNDKFMPGVYFSIQIGNDDFCNANSLRTNYYVPLCGFGNYDFRHDVDHVDKDDKVFYNLHTDSGKSNPFTGYHLMLMPAFDLAADLTPDTIFPQEWISYINTIYFNQQAIPDTVFRDQCHTYLGSVCDHFGEGRVLSVSTNPATVPLLTYSTEKSRNIQPSDSPDSTLDNRSIMLNGLYIEILDKDHDGNARIKVLFNHWGVEDDVRWTGDILLRDTLLLQAGKTITLDQGLTPTRPVRPVYIGGEKIFAGPTEFICQHGSYLEINDAARMVLTNGSTLKLESGSEIRVRGSGRVFVDPGSSIEAEQGASIIMENEASEMIFMPGSTASICPAKCSGKGKIKGIPAYLDFQDQSLDGTSLYRTWGNIEINNVILEDHADLTFLAGDEIVIEGPFQTGDDVQLLIKSICPAD